MSGVEYYRRKHRLTLRMLAELSGVTVVTIRSYEKKGIPENAPVDSLVALADVFEVSMDELLKEHDENELTTTDRNTYESAIQVPTNVISNYRFRQNLRYQELAERLQLGARESARVACRRKTALPKHIQLICRYENMSAEEFVTEYSAPFYR